MVHIFYFIQSIMLEKNSEHKKKLMDFFFHVDQNTMWQQNIKLQGYNLCLIFTEVIFIPHTLQGLYQ